LPRDLHLVLRPGDGEVRWAKTAPTFVFACDAGSAVPTCVAATWWARRSRHRANSPMSRPPLPTLRFDDMADDVEALGLRRRHKQAHDRTERPPGHGGKKEDPPPR